MPAFPAIRHVAADEPVQPALLRAWRLLARWLERRRQRRALADLDDHLLADIGVTRRQAEAESRKLPWR